MSGGSRVTVSSGDQNSREQRSNFKRKKVLHTSVQCAPSIHCSKNSFCEEEIMAGGTSSKPPPPPIPPLLPT